MLMPLIIISLYDLLNQRTFMNIYATVCTIVLTHVKCKQTSVLDPDSLVQDPDPAF
jgi:hypothetical protein